MLIDIDGSQEERLKFLQSIIAPVPRPTISGPGSLSPTSPRSTSSPPSPLQDPKDVETLHTLILSHLIQSGYHDSALAFYKSTRSIASSDIIQKPVSQSTHHSANSTTFDSLPGASSIQLRKAIRQQVSKGDIDSTLSLLSSSSPTLLQSKPLLHFGLCLQKFIELVRAQNGSSAMIVEGGDDGMDVDGQSSPGQKHSSSSSSSEGLLQVIEYGKQVQTQFSSLLLDANVYEAMTVCPILCVCMYSLKRDCSKSFL